MGRTRAEKKKQSRFAIIIFILIIVGLVIFGIYHFSSTMNGVPSDAKVMTDENMQDFINEQKEQGIDVEVVN